MVDAKTSSSLSGASLQKAMTDVHGSLKEGGGSNVTVALVSKPATAAPNGGFAESSGPRVRCGRSGDTNIFLNHGADEYGNPASTTKDGGKSLPHTVQNVTSAPANVNGNPPKYKAKTSINDNDSTIAYITVEERTVDGILIALVA